MVPHFLLFMEANSVREMALQAVYSGVVPDLLAPLRQITARLNQGLEPETPWHPETVELRTATRLSVIKSLSSLPLRDQIEVVQILRCLSEVVNSTREQNNRTIEDTVSLLKDVTVQAVLLKDIEQGGVNFDLDPALLNLTVKTVSSVMTSLAWSPTLFNQDSSRERESSYRRISADLRNIVQVHVALQLQTHSLGEVPVQVASPFLSVYATHLQVDMHQPTTVSLQDATFTLPDSTSFFPQHGGISESLHQKASGGLKENSCYRPSRLSSALDDGFQTTTNMPSSSSALGQDSQAIQAHQGSKSSRGVQELFEDSNCFQSRVFSYRSDPYNLINGKPGRVQTAVASLDLYSCSGSRRLQVKGQTKSNFIAIDIQRQQNTDAKVEKPSYYLGKNNMNIHNLKMSRQTKYPALSDEEVLKNRLLHIRIQIEDNIAPGRLAFPLLVFIAPMSAPFNTKRHIFRQVFNQSVKDIKIILPLSQIIDPGGKSYSVGIAEGSLNAGRRRSIEVKGQSYNLSAWWDTCVYWDGCDQKWKHEGCKVTQSSSLQVLRCDCSNMTSFGGFYDLIPHNLTVFSVDEFFSSHKNPLIVVIVGAALLIFVVILLMIQPLKRHDDTKRRERIIFSQDNCPYHRQKYEVVMETGFHPDAGCTSKISLILHGEEGVSETRELIAADSVYLFQRNSRNRFIITFPENLGRILKIQLWHNNSGSSPGWFLRQAIVRDLNTGHSFYFLCQKWLAVDKDDGKVEREFSTLDGSAVTFSQVFIIKGAQYLSDLHTWLSVFTCPPHCHFTRMQRLFLCLALLMSYMGFATLWFYLKPPLMRGEFGLLDLSWRNIVTGALICCLTFPINMILAFLFRRSCMKSVSSNLHEGFRRKSGLDLASQGEEEVGAGSVPYSILDQSILNWQHIQEWAHRQWQKRQSHVITSNDPAKDDQDMQRQSAIIPLVQQTMLAGEEDTELGSSGFEDATSQATADRNRIMAPSDISSIRKKSESDSSESSVQFNSSKRLLFPWWCRYLAWVICLSLIAVGTAATVWYGFRFGHKRSVMWIQCVYFSLITDVFLLQPAMVLLKTLCAYLRYCQNPAVLDMVHDTEEDLDLEWEERRRQEMNSWQEEDDIQQALAARTRSRYLRFAGPLQEKQLKTSRRRQAQENKALALLRNGSLLTFITLLVLVLTFGRNRSYQVHLNQAAHQMFTGQVGSNSNFMSIKSLSDWYEWSKVTFLPAVSSLNNLIDVQKRRSASELGEIVGNIQLRQIRVKPEPCLSIPPLKAVGGWCFHDYTADAEDMDFSDSTTPQSETYPGVWGFLTWYGNTGQVVSFNNSRTGILELIESMEHSQWLNHQTRAVMLELTIYNPPSRLYSSIMLLLEMSASGKLLPSVHIRSSHLFHYVSLWEDFLLTCELILLFAIIILFSCTAQKMFQQRLSYYKHFWNCIEMFMSLVSLLYLLMFIYRFVLVMEIVERLRSTFYEEFVSFAFLGLWDQIIHTLLGLLLFCVLLQWLRLVSYNPTIARLLLVFKKTEREILLAAALFGVQLIAFSSMGNVLFGIVYQPMSSFVSSATTFAALSIRIFNQEEIAESSSVYFISILSLFAFVFLHGLTLVYLFTVLVYRLKRIKTKRRLSMPPKRLLQFYWNYFCQQTGSKRNLPTPQYENNLSPEFIMAEILYLVEELLFRMNNLLGTSGLPEKQQSFTDSDSSPDPGDDGISTGESEEIHALHASNEEDNMGISEFTRLDDRVHRIEDKLCSNEPYLAQLLKLDSFGTNILSEEEEQDLRSQLEFEIFQQLQKERQESTDIDVPTHLFQSKVPSESPKIIASAPTPTFDSKDGRTAQFPKTVSGKSFGRPDIMSSPLHSLKFHPESNGDSSTIGESKSGSKLQTSIPVITTKSLKRSQSLKVPVRDNASLIDSYQVNKRPKQGPFPDKDVDCNRQARLLMNRHSSVKGRKEMMAFDKLGKKDTRLTPATSILRKPGLERGEKELVPLSHKLSSGNVSPQSSEGERGHRRTDSSSGQSGADSRLDTPKMVGKRLDLPPRPTFTHNSILAPPKSRPLDLMGEWMAAESSSGSEQEAGLASKRMCVGRRNLRKTKSRGKGKGNDVDIDSAIVLAEDFQARGHRGISDCSIIIHPIPAYVDLDEISIPEEV